MVCSRHGGRRVVRDVTEIRHRHEQEHPYHQEHFGKFGWNAHIDRGELLAAVDERDEEIARLLDVLAMHDSAVEQWGDTRLAARVGELEGALKRVRVTLLDDGRHDPRWMPSDFVIDVIDQALQS